MESIYDRVTVDVPDEHHEGTVISAVNLGTAEQADWFIQFDCEPCKESHYLRQVKHGYKEAKIVLTLKEV